MHEPAHLDPVEAIIWSGLVLVSLLATPFIVLAYLLIVPARNHLSS